MGLMRVRKKLDRLDSTIKLVKPMRIAEKFIENQSYLNHMHNSLQESYVDSGEVEVCKGDGILKVAAIGSCVAITAYDPNSMVAGIAHVMLPGKSNGKKRSDKTKYAVDAIEKLISSMVKLGANKAELIICLIGGGNVLGVGQEELGAMNVHSTTNILKKKKITPVAMVVGGNQRRSCSLNANLGRVSYTIGGSEEMILWQH